MSLVSAPSRFIAILSRCSTISSKSEVSVGSHTRTTAGPSISRSLTSSRYSSGTEVNKTVREESLRE